MVVSTSPLSPFFNSAFFYIFFFWFMPISIFILCSFHLLSPSSFTYPCFHFNLMPVSLILPSSFFNPFLSCLFLSILITIFFSFLLFYFIHYKFNFFFFPLSSVCVPLPSLAFYLIIFLFISASKTCLCNQEFDDHHFTLME